METSQPGPIAAALATVLRNGAQPERILGTKDCKWCMPENSDDPPKWCRNWDGCKLAQPKECKCACVSSDYSDHALSCPFYVAGRAARIARAQEANKRSPERIVFEEWAATRHMDLYQPYGHYQCSITVAAWAAWQASRCSPARHRVRALTAQESPNDEESKT